MSERSAWRELRSRRMAEPGAADAYDAARLAFELGRQVRELRVQMGLSRTELAATGSLFVGGDPSQSGEIDLASPALRW